MSRGATGGGRRRAELEALWLAQLRWEWGEINDERLAHALRPPVFLLGDGIGQLGSWRREGRVLTIARHHIETAPWREVLVTLRHEMAHQYANEVLKADDETAHGPAFAHACALLRLDAHGQDLAAGAAAPHDEPTARVVERIQKLLALGGSENQHEAELAMATAHRLLLAHNIALQDAKGERRYARQAIGPIFGAVPLRHKWIAGALAEFFFVEAVWCFDFDAKTGRSGRRLELFGKAHDLELACYVHDFLLAALERLFVDAVRRGEVGRDGRRDYHAGVLIGFRAKLRQERDVQRERGLVWVADADLQGYLRDEIGATSNFGSVGPRDGAALETGRRDGAGLTLHRPLHTSGGGGGLLSGPR